MSFSILLVRLCKFHPLSVHDSSRIKEGEDEI